MANDDGAERVGLFGVWLVVLSLVAFLVLMLHVFVVIWPNWEQLPGSSAASSTTKATQPAAGSAGALMPFEEMRFFTWFGNGIGLNVSRPTRLLLLVAVSGALGAFIQVASSFADYAANRTLTRSWLVWYVLRLAVGTVIAIVVYLVLRAGFLGLQNNSVDVNLYGISALAALSGWFSKEAADKMREVFRTMFKTDQDAFRKDKVDERKPKIDSVTPAELPLNSSTPVTLEVSGRRFDGQMSATLDGKKIEVVGTVTATKFQASVPVSELTRARKAKLVVVNPSDRGGASDGFEIEVK